MCKDQKIFSNVQSKKSGELFNSRQQITHKMQKTSNQMNGEVNNNLIQLPNTMFSQGDLAGATVTVGSNITSSDPSKESNLRTQYLNTSSVENDKNLLSTFLNLNAAVPQSNLLFKTEGEN